MEKVKINGVDLVKYLLIKYGPLPQKNYKSFLILLNMNTLKNMEEDYLI
ncbi:MULTISPECIES: hypothetical protein [Acidiplasma]|jgi:hypothetical protein|nr:MULTISPECIES: hypothetical protein [Acidiplasma]WMT55830.1 MAG: hypothetical protein RE470_04085 [Acidiplasma sp.]